MVDRRSGDKPIPGQGQPIGLDPAMFPLPSTASNTHFLPSPLRHVPPTRRKSWFWTAVPVPVPLPPLPDFSDRNLCVDEDALLEGLAEAERNQEVTTDSDEAWIIAQLVKVMGPQISSMREDLREERIGRLVEAILPGEPLSPVSADIEVDNARLRARYLETVPTYTAAQLHELSGSRSQNKSALASGWKKDGRVFAVTHRGADRFPAFQFADGAPRPEIKRILSALPESLTTWQVALWFASGSGWLDDEAPQDRLDDVEAVLLAAERAITQAVG